MYFVAEFSRERRCFGCLNTNEVICTLRILFKSERYGDQGRRIMGAVVYKFGIVSIIRTFPFVSSIFLGYSFYL